MRFLNLRLLIFLAFFPTPMMAQEDETTTPLGALIARLEVVGSISASETGSQRVGIVIFRDTKDDKTVVVPIGRPFKIAGNTYVLKSAQAKSVLVSDGQNNAVLSISDGRLVNAAELRSRKKTSSEGYGNEDYAATNLRNDETAAIDNEDGDDEAVDVDEDSDTPVATTSKSANVSANKAPAVKTSAKSAWSDDEEDESVDNAPQQPAAKDSALKQVPSASSEEDLEEEE